MSDGPKYVTDCEAQEVVESGYELVSDSLPATWSVTVIAIDEHGRAHVASAAPDMEEVARRVSSWGKKMLVTDDEGRALPPKEARH